MVRRRIAVDVALAALLFVFGVSVGSFASRHFAGQPRFYQDEFGPAVMVAAGRGFVNPAIAARSPLADFLATRRPALNIADVPNGAGAPLDQFQQATRYLMLALGYTWRVVGISWAAVSHVSAALCGLTVLACYFICRLWVSRGLATFGALFFAFSPLHLAQIPHVRDYSKAPFILLAIALVAVVSLRPLTRRMLVALSAACGVVVGVGLGFKMDVVIMAPIFLASVVMFRGPRPWCMLGDKGLAAVAFMLALMLAAAPVLLRLSSGGSNGYHAILLGYADQFDDSLGVARPAYSVLPFYDDGYVAAVVRDYGLRTTGEAPAVPSPAYDTAGRAYWLAIVRHFPADIFARALGSANVILNLPFDSPALNFMRPSVAGGNAFSNFVTNQPPHRARLGAIFERITWLNGTGIAFGVLMIGAASVSSARTGMFVAWMLLALTGYASLQFADRHFFHLEVIPILGVLVAADVALRRRWLFAAAGRRFAIAVAVLLVVLVSSLAMLRTYQSSHLARMFQGYVDSSRDAVSAAFVDTGNGTWRATWHDASQAPYYSLEFEGAPGHELAPVEIHYKASPASADYSRVVSMSETAGVNRVFVPAYADIAGAAFDGVEMPTRMKNALRGIYRTTLPEPHTLLLDLRLTGHWRDDPLYQSLRVERSRGVGGVRWFGSAAGTPLSRIAWMEHLAVPATMPNPGSVAVTYTTAARVTAAGVQVDGAAETQSSYLLEFKPVVVTTTAALLVRGRIESGGVSLGVLESGRWHRQVTISEPGDFVAVVGIETPGTFVPIVTNATRRDHDRNTFTLSRFGVVTLETTGPAR